MYCRGIVSTQCFYCVFHAFERHRCTISEAGALSQFNAWIVHSNLIVCCLASEALEPWVRLTHCLNSVVVLCFTRIWSTSGYHKGGRGIVLPQCLYCALHASERHQGTMSEAEALSHSMLILCFTRIWATSGYHKWGRGIVSTQCLYCVLRSFERRQGTMSEAEGLSQLNACIVLVTSGYHKWAWGIVST
jgi:hypothetical protein